MGSQQSKTANAASKNKKRKAELKTLGDVEGSPEMYQDFKDIADVYTQAEAEAQALALSQCEFKAEGEAEPGSERKEMDGFIEKFKETKDVGAWLTIIGKSSDSDPSRFAAFTKAMTNAQRLKRLFDELDAAGIFNDKKLKPTFTEMLDLVYFQNELFFQTVVIMKSVRGQAELCSFAVQTWQQQMENSTPDKEVVEKCVLRLNDWFENEKALDNLRQKWDDYHKKVRGFSNTWNTVKDEIVAKCRKLPQISAAWAVVAGLGGVALTYGITHLTVLIGGACIVASSVVTGFGAAAIIGVGAYLTYKMVRRYININKKSKAVSKLIVDSGGSADKVSDELKRLMDDGEKIKGLCKKLVLEIQEQSRTKKFIMDAVSYKNKQRIREKLRELDKSFGHFIECCDTIIDTVTRDDF